MLYGSADIKDLVSKAKELGQPAIALTDYGNLYNAIQFYKACESADIKPILGADVFFCDDAAEFKAHKMRQVLHVVLLAENETGWKNLTRIISESNDENHAYYRPRVDFALLEKYKEGLICLSGSSTDGIIPYHLYDKTDDAGDVKEHAALFRAEALVRRFIGIFGKDHFFLEVQDTGNDEQTEVNMRLRSIATKYGLKTVATGNVHYTNKGDAEAHKTLLVMGSSNYTKSTTNPFDDDEFYLKSRDEMADTSLQDDELDMTLELADRCTVTIDVKKRRLPSYKFVPEGKTAMEYLRELAVAGLARS
jgi:DNA polymerase-3 subunit alpha